VGLTNSYSELLLYKLRYIGLRNTLRVGYLDLSEHLFYQISKRFPSVSISSHSIQIECTTRCNLKCTMCEISYWTEKGGDLKAGNLQKMVDHLPKLKRVDLTGVGEALMNRGFFNALELLKARGVYVTLNDNFTLMNEKAARRIVELGVDQIFLSLDGATKETYERIRVGANFDKVISNARRLMQVKRDMRKKRPEVKINTVVCLTNYHELPAIVELAHEIGVGMVQFVNVITFESTTDLDTAGVQQEVRAKFRDALQRARQLGILVKVELFNKLPVQQCDFPWRRNFVTYDGYVHPCCYTTQTGDRRAQNQRSLGNLLDHSFTDVWRSEVYSAFRSKLQRGILPTACGHCPKYVGAPDVHRLPVKS
jgi:MoaA/NifB/PqqE/SkfB family radical SAM enzyme